MITKLKHVIFSMRPVQWVKNPAINTGIASRSQTQFSKSAGAISTKAIVMTCKSPRSP